MEAQTHRKACRIEQDFDLIADDKVPVRTALSKFERLWDETNHAASACLGCVELNDYVGLLLKMQAWYERAEPG